MTNRRQVLALLAAAPFSSACATQSLPDPVAAWRDPGAGETDPRRFALAHAILAPNPHNTQPWLVELDGADGMTLYCDLDRRLPFTDPLDRQITMGCGAFLELYRIAASARGYAPVITPFPESAPLPRLDERPIAHVALGEPQAIEPDPLFTHIVSRRTNRDPYGERIPTENALRDVASAAMIQPVQAFAENAPDRVARLRDLVWRAFDREMRTRGAQEETFGWLRFGREEIARHRDGLAIDGPMIPLFKALGFLDLEDMLDPDSTSNKQAAADWRRKAEAAPAFMWLTTQDDGPASRIAAGMAYARMNLAATAAGLAMHPWSQALQEYPEMADLYAEAGAVLAAGEATVQMLVRVGYADPVAPAARRGLSEHIRA